MYYGLPISPYDLTNLTTKDKGQELFVRLKNGQQWRCIFIDSDNEGFNMLTNNNGVESEYWIPYSFIRYISMLHHENGKMVVKTL